MQNPLTALLDRLPRFPIGSPRLRHWQMSLWALGFAASLTGSVWSIEVRAESPATAPAPLKAALSQLDAAANQHSVKNVLQFYGPNFTHSDGLTRQTLEEALTQLWKRYPDATYRTELKSWQPVGNAVVAETVTYITGTQKVGDRQFKLNATLTARQRFENQKIVKQEILNERSQITTGSKPPTIKLSLPKQVTVGQDYSVDAIVEEPLGKDLLLGAALEEAVKPDGYINPTTANLELLSAGGIFKVGRAPNKPENRWISAVVVRHDGMTMVTERLQVLDRKK